MPIVTDINGEKIREDTRVPVRADICLNAMGVINRLNPSQLIEGELNFASQNIRYNMEELKSIDDQYNLAIDFVRTVNPPSAEAMEAVWNMCETKEDQEDLISQWIKNGFYIQQLPFWGNNNIFDLEKIYKKFNILHKYQTDKVKIPLILGEIYYFRLKHLPSGKLSARATGNYNYNNLPTKSTDIKKSIGYVSSVPIRLG